MVHLVDLGHEKQYEGTASAVATIPYRCLGEKARSSVKSDCGYMGLISIANKETKVSDYGRNGHISGRPTSYVVFTFQGR